MDNKKLFRIPKILILQTCQGPTLQYGKFIFPITSLYNYIREKILFYDFGKTEL